MWQSSGNICRCLKTIDLDKVVFCYYFISVFVVVLFFAGVWLDSSSHFPVSSVLRL